MALLKTELERIFLFKNKDKVEITLDDPNPKFNPNAVLNFYSATYPQLTTAKMEGPEFKDDKMVYRFVTTLGTKG